MHGHIEEDKGKNLLDDGTFSWNV